MMELTLILDFDPLGLELKILSSYDAIFLEIAVSMNSSSKILVLLTIDLNSSLTNLT